MRNLISRSLLLATGIVMLGCSKNSELEVKSYYTRNYPALARTSPTALLSLPESNITEQNENLEGNSDLALGDATSDNALGDIAAGTALGDIAAGTALGDKTAEKAPGDTTSNNAPLVAQAEIAAQDASSANQGSQDFYESPEGLIPEGLVTAGLTADASNDLNAFPVDGSATDKMLFAIFKAFDLRDTAKFNTLSREFLLAYPNSEYVSKVKNLQSNFYYNIALSNDLLSNQYVEYDNFNFTGWEDFKSSLTKLSHYGARSLIFTPFQNGVNRSLPFANSQSAAGALYKSKKIPVSADVLSEVSKISSSLGYKLQVKLPLKNHAWLNYRNSELMDQSWDKGREYFNYNNKLNWFHPKALEYIKGIIDELATFDIDGIIISDDYSLEFNEGYSSLTGSVYEVETKKKLSPNIIPADFYSNNFASTNSAFLEVQKWRIDKQHLFLLNVVNYIRVRHPLLKIGLEIDPELINNPRVTILKRSTSYAQLISLKPDFIILNRESGDSVDQASYATALSNLQKKIKYSGPVVLRLEYDQDGLDNLLVNYERIRSLQTTDNSSFIFGPKVPKNDWLYLTQK